MATHDFNNQSSQSERKAIVKNDTLFARQSNTVDDAGGRFAKLTPTKVIGSTPSPQYPQLPASSPWSQFDQNVEPELGIDVNEMPAPAVPEEPTPCVASSAGVGSEPVAEVASFPASSVTGSSIKRRVW
jgi:hypothetical protein